MTIFVLTLIEVLVMTTLVAGILKLHADWHVIEPPPWRMIILGFLLVVTANALFLLWAITSRRPVDLATVGLASSYVALLGSLMGARFHLNMFRSES